MGLENPAISVIMPVYNAENYLMESLNSLRTQAFGDFEVVCINDGSRDRSLTIIEHYAATDKRIRVIDKENTGYGSTMNLGLQEARGRFIAILEPDDFFEPDALKKLVTIADALNADVVKANYWFYWSGKGRRSKNQLISAVGKPQCNHLFLPREEPEIFFVNPSVWSALYKRSFILGNGLKFNETPGASFQDLAFTFKVWARAERAYCIEDPIIHYRQDNEQSSVNDPRKVFCVCDEFDEIEDFMAIDPNGSMLRPYAYRLRYDSYMWNYERLSLDLRIEFLDTMVGDLARGMQEGDYSPLLFASHQRANLRLLLEDPKTFLKLFPEKPTRLAKVRYYRKLGGLKMVKEARN